MNGSHNNRAMGVHQHMDVTQLIVTVTRQLNTNKTTIRMTLLITIKQDRMLMPGLQQIQSQQYFFYTVACKATVYLTVLIAT